MSVRTVGMLCGAMGLLSACDAAGVDTPTQDELTTTGFAQPSATGVINIGLEDNITSRVAQTSAGSGIGYAFQTGAIPQEGLFAVAGLLPGTAASMTPRPSGTASYSGTYNLVEVENIDLGGGFITGDPTLRSGNVTLISNFASGSIIDSGTSALSVNGTVNGANLGGTVTYNGVQGNLDGLIGGNRAIGAFHGEGNVGPGSEDDYMYAGGFITTRN